MECLLAFGPVHGWWSFPFKWINGLLQRLNTNYKPGEMPITYMKYFYLGVNLRWLVTEIDWPDVQVFHDWVDAFKAAFKDATRGIRFTEISAYLTAAAAYTYNERQQTP
ncbi:hypothetical protein C8Q74DRAFT_1366864 [Fomes fomentarius]|nr:hypothetical protein C8Q74DRAFT_1366864 [Fomes fomentarius]